MKHLLSCLSLILTLTVHAPANAISIYDNNKFNLDRVFNPNKSRSKPVPSSPSNSRKYPSSHKKKFDSYYKKKKKSSSSANRRDRRAEDLRKRLPKEEASKKDYKELNRDEVKVFAPARATTTRAK